MIESFLKALTVFCILAVPVAVWMAYWTTARSLCRWATRRFGPHVGDAVGLTSFLVFSFFALWALVALDAFGTISS